MSTVLICMRRWLFTVKCVMRQQLNRCSVAIRNLLFLQEEFVLARTPGCTEKSLDYSHDYRSRSKALKASSSQWTGSEKGDTLPLFWCPSSTAPPWSWICKDKKVWTIMYLSPNNLIRSRSCCTCTISTHFRHYFYAIIDYCMLTRFT